MAPVACQGHRRSCRLVGRIRSAHLAAARHRDSSWRSCREHPWALPHPAGVEGRPHHPDRPELGGLVIKQLFRTLEMEARNSAGAAILLDRIDKVAFLATPHTGADLPIWGDRLRVLVRPSAATMSPCAQRPEPARPQQLVSPAGE